MKSIVLQTKRSILQRTFGQPLQVLRQSVSPIEAQIESVRRCAYIVFSASQPAIRLRQEHTATMQFASPVSTKLTLYRVLRSLFHLQSTKATAGGRDYRE
jgi:hypothetical protein